MADYVQKQYVKNENFNLEAVTTLAGEEGGAKFNRVGYHFTNWKDGAGSTYEDQQLTAFSTNEVALSAVWQKNKYAVTYTTYLYGTIDVTADGAPVQSGSEVDYETQLTIVATPNEGRKITSLMINNVEQIITPSSSAVTKTFTVGASAVSILATFDDNHGIITYYPGY